MKHSFIVTKPELHQITQDELFKPTTQTAEQRHTRIKFNEKLGCWEVYDASGTLLSTDHASHAGAEAWEQQYFVDLLNKEEIS